MTKGRSFKYALGGLVAVLGMVAIRLAPPYTSSALLHDRMLGIHLVLELFSIVVAALVVTVSWHTFDRRVAQATHVLIGGFTVVGVCDLLHVLTYRGMPEFLSESSTPRAIFFWLMGRSFEAATVAALGLGLVPKRSRGFWLAAGAVTAAAIVGVGSFALDSLPTTFVDGTGVTPFKAGCEYALCAANLLLAAALWRRGRRTRTEQAAMLSFSSLAMGIGGLAFTSYVAPSDFQNIVGHLYKVAAYVLLYRATFMASIRAPYDALEESETRMRTLGANLPQTVLFQMVRERDDSIRFTQVSDAIERVHGLRAADVMRQPSTWFGQVHPDDRPALSAARRRSQETLQVFDHEARFVLASGRIRTMHLVAVPRRLDDDLVAWDGFVTDVTERILAAEARRALELQLREAQKMESIGTLASGIAHDFNNVLASILGNTAMASEDARVRGWDEMTRALDQIRRAAEHARNLVRQILTFTRKQPPRRVAQALAPIVEEHLALLRATLPANVEVVFDPIDVQVAAQVDRTQLGQVLLNLCTNAWHAMGPSGGTIEVGLDTLVLAGEPAVRVGLAPGPYARVRVEDTGCGMDEPTIQRIFEPFFTTKPVGKGTGLGLSVVHGIVQAHDGAIRLTSSPGAGARFEILLPATAADGAAPGDAAQAGHATRVGQGQRVLVVDDDEVMGLMVERLLTRAGFAVTSLDDADEAVALFARDPGRFDVLVTDYNMPQLSGLEVARRVLTLRPGLPTIISSGYVSAELLALARAQGVAEVIEKQDTLEELTGAIERALAGARSARGRPVGSTPLG